MSDEFPESILDVLDKHLGAIEGVAAVYARSLTELDMNGSIGIDVAEWIPEEYEMWDGLAMEPTTSYYIFSIQHLVKAEKIEAGREAHRKVAKSIRTMLYRDGPLNVALRQLSDVSGPRPQHLLKWVVTGQNFGSSLIDSNFVSLSVTEVVFKIQTP